MKKTKTFVTLAATALATLFIASSTYEPAAARSGHSMSGGHSSSGGRSFSGGRSYSRTFRSPSVNSSRMYSYRSDGNRHRHHHHFRGRNFVYGYDNYYGYSDSCYWLRRRALATGSSYWWNRYYDCTNDY